MGISSIFKGNDEPVSSGTPPSEGNGTSDIVGSYEDDVEIRVDHPIPSLLFPNTVKAFDIFLVVEVIYGDPALYEQGLYSSAIETFHLMGNRRNHVSTWYIWNMSVTSCADLSYDYNGAGIEFDINPGQTHSKTGGQITYTSIPQYNFLKRVFTWRLRTL